MPIAQETIYWGDGAAQYKLTRLARAFRTAKIRDTKAFIRMIGSFPKSSGGAFAVKAKEKYMETMRDGRDYLLMAQVYQDDIDAYVPLFEAPTNQFVYVVTAHAGSEKRGNPFGSGQTLSVDEALSSGLLLPASESGESAASMKRVIDPFDFVEGGGEGEPWATELEVKLYESSGRRLSLPGEFTAKFKIQNSRLEEIGTEWQVLQERLKQRFLRGTVSEMEFTFSVEANIKPDDSFKATLKSFSAEAKVALSAKVRIPYLRQAITVEVGVKGDHEGKLGSVLEISW